MLSEYLDTAVLPPIIIIHYTIISSLKIKVVVVFSHSFWIVSICKNNAHKPSMYLHV